MPPSADRSQVSPGYDVLHADDGSPIPLAEALEKHGYDTVQHSLLQWRLFEHASKKKLRGYPPKLFLSYHRSSRESIETVSFLADKLRSNGFHVLFDENDLVEDELGLGIAKFVSRLAECHIFVPVITDGYLKDDRASTLTWWLHEESQWAINLHTQGLMDIVCIWLATRDPPEPPTSWYFGHVPIVDLRRFDLSLLSRALSYQGPILSDNEESAVIALLEEFEKPDLSKEQLVDLHAAIEQFPVHLNALEEMRIAQVQYCALTGSDAYRDSLRALEDAPALYPPNRLRLVRALFKIDDCKAILRNAWPLLHFRRSPNLVEVHMMMGLSLRDLANPIGAVNHLSRSFQLSDNQTESWKCMILNEIGWVLLRLGQATASRRILEAACDTDKTDWRPVYNLIRCLCTLELWADAIELRNGALDRFPDDVEHFLLNGPLVEVEPDGAHLVLDGEGDLGCTVCEACFPRSQGLLLCSACGSANHVSPCGICSHTYFKPVVWRDGRRQDLCPVCREGVLQHGARTHLSQR